jgi:hypothetical protein
MSEVDDTNSECSEASLGETINEIEGCLDKLSRIESEKFILFTPPDTDEERAAIWTKYDIQERICTEDLADLLHRLATAERDKPWFTWLRWILFGI